MLYKALSKSKTLLRRTSFGFVKGRLGWVVAKPPGFPFRRARISFALTSTQKERLQDFPPQQGASSSTSGRGSSSSTPSGSNSRDSLHSASGQTPPQLAQ